MRLQDGRLEAPFRADGRVNAYLPQPEGTDLPTVKETIAGDEHAAAFLKRLGLDEPDFFDDINHRILPKYTDGSVSVSPDEHAADIQKIFRALASDLEGGKKKVYMGLISASGRVQTFSVKKAQSAAERRAEIHFESDGYSASGPLTDIRDNQVSSHDDRGLYTEADLDSFAIDDAQHIAGFGRSLGQDWPPLASTEGMALIRPSTMA